MKKAVDDGCAPLSRLPDDIVVQIYNKVGDLKTLCYCQLISKRLGLLVFEADTIIFNVPLRFDYENENRLDDMKILFESFRFPIKKAASVGAFDSDPGPLLGSDSFPSAIKFIKRFTKLKSLCIQFPSYVNVVAGVNVFKRRTVISFIDDVFIIAALNYVLAGEDIEENEEENDKDSDEYIKAYACFMDVIDRFKKVLGCSVELPLLEKVFVLDSNKGGIVSLSGGEIDELRNFLNSYGTSKYLRIGRVDFSDTESRHDEKKMGTL